MTLREIQETQARFDNGHKPSFSFSDASLEGSIDALEHLIVCVVGELGEFANVVKKIRRGEFNYGEKKGELSEELADIFIYVVKLSNLLRTDLETEFLEKLDKNRLRFDRFKK